MLTTKRSISVARNWLGLAAICAGSLTAGSAAAFDRIAASTFAQTPAKVAALRKAVAAMRARDSAAITSTDYKKSWDYWAATHGYFGTGTNASGTAADFKAQAAQICAGASPSQRATCKSYYAHVKDLTVPNDGMTDSIWGTCQHSDGTPNLQFLTWHRMYLHYFERAMRASSGDPNFALPYWDYGGEKGPNNGIAIPALVRGASTGAMYDQFRTPGLNENTKSIANNAASAVQAFKFSDFSSFSAQLEQQPHGSMHCATGFGCRAPDMGIVPVAGLDPVFYMHHANIDRLWQCWLVRKAAGHPITLAWAKANLGMPDSWYEQTYTFADENGAKATMAVKSIFDPAFMDYKYDKETNCVPGLNLAAAARVERVQPVYGPGPVELKGQAISVDLNAAPQGAAVSPLPTEVKTEPGHVLLILQDVQIVGSPLATYDIQIHRKGAPDKTAYIATLSFFGQIGPRHHGSHNAEPGSKTLFYDVGVELEQLGITDSADLAVRFVPSDGPPEGLAASADAGSVKVGAIRLQATRGEVVKAISPDQPSKWTYRSYRNDPTLINGDASKALALLFAEASMIFETPAHPGELKGVLDMGGGYYLDLSGKMVPAQGAAPALITLSGIGRAGTPTDGWEYDYRGYLVQAWPNGVSQRPAFVGSVIRAKPHDGAPAGYTASFISILQE